jgi:branched-chain amino acid transport system permease protein
MTGRSRRRSAGSSALSTESTAASRLRGRPALAVAAGVGLLAAPLVLPAYMVLVLSYAVALAIACLGLNLLLGQTGLLSLGQAAYFGTGAYAGAFVYAFTPLTSLEAYLATGVVASTVLAAILGVLCVRATRIHFTILTLATAQVLHSLFISGAVFRAIGGQGRGLFLLGGGGLYIPRFTMAGVELPPETFSTAFFYVIVAAFGVALGLLWRVVHSPFGKALAAIRDNDTRATFIGIPVRRYRWYAFVISGAVTGLAGGLWGQLSRQVTPPQLHWLFSAELVLATVLGGTGHFWGPVAGAFALVAIQELALRATHLRGLVLGTLLVALVLVCPGGLAGGRAAFRAWAGEFRMPGGGPRR